MEGLSSTISLAFKTIIGAIIPPIKKRYFDQPKIYLVLKKNTSAQMNRGASLKNPTHRAITINEALYNFDLTWEYEFIMRNNSEFAAYNIKLLQPLISAYFHFHSGIDFLKPILPNTELTHNVKFYLPYEGTGQSALNLISNPPKLLDDSTFIIEYTNSRGTKFYTNYNHNKHEEKRNEFAHKDKYLMLKISIISLFLFFAFAFSFIFYTNNKIKPDPKTDTERVRQRSMVHDTLYSPKIVNEPKAKNNITRIPPKKETNINGKNINTETTNTGNVVNGINNGVNGNLTINNTIDPHKRILTDSLKTIYVKSITQLLANNDKGKDFPIEMLSDATWESKNYATEIGTFLQTRGYAVNLKYIGSCNYIPCFIGLNFIYKKDRIVINVGCWY